MQRPGRRLAPAISMQRLPCPVHPAPRRARGVQPGPFATAARRRNRKLRAPDHRTLRRLDARRTARSERSTPRRPRKKNDGRIRLGPRSERE